MNTSGRIFERTLDEIPAILYRDDGKQSEVFKNDELYAKLGEPIAPTIVTVPALIITVKDGNYIFFGDGIQIDDIENEYERLKFGIKVVKEMQRRKNLDTSENNQNLLDTILDQIPKIDLPFLPGKKKKD